MDIIITKLEEILKELSGVTINQHSKFERIANRTKALAKKKFGDDSEFINQIFEIQRTTLLGLRVYHLSQLRGIIHIMKDEIEITQSQQQNIQKPTSINVIKAHGWSDINIRIQAVAKDRFQNGHYADAVEASFKEINDIIKKQYKNKLGDEIDGDTLMRKAFTSSQNNNYTPHFKLADNSTESGRNIQQGYMDIFAGSMKGIRNPKAHANHHASPDEAWEMIVLASHLMRMWEKHN